MKKLPLIIGIVFSGMLMQAQTEIMKKIYDHTMRYILIVLLATVLVTGCRNKSVNTTLFSKGANTLIEKSTGNSEQITSLVKGSQPLSSIEKKTTKKQLTQDTIKLFVALWDSPPESDLYWGKMYWVKPYFTRSENWEIIRTTPL